MRKLIAAACVVASVAVAGTALAITNGGPDGNGHPNVGAVLAPHAYSDGTWTTCSGTLISSTVFLTAAHCDQGIATVNVTFASDYKSGVSKTYAGTWHADPRYRG